MNIFQVLRSVNDIAQGLKNYFLVKLNQKDVLKFEC